ncbi:enoyl-[acyl-carrier-protein] reductase [NADH] [Capsulimonas corticalis]|uniref:Enoyl-[acyl-carrier-protein] reductase [NADH] n=1 Tax=Capsulimonas corticalis TaxID=2219043 RepID=A0A402CXD9_9BACT|nr:enoyl-ACP reductase [Capsulimonas corticalis]BDI32303.1 enoyl-[acyl-carrier-protein] reductase [NADH] [Capsulimonas corticalis]
MGILDGKKGLIYGVRNERSLCWGCAQSLAREGAQLALTFLGEREEKDVRKMAPTLPGGDKTVIQGCDLTDEAQVAALHETLAREFGQLDFVIHGAAFANKADLDGRFLDTSRDGFLKALEISAYTLTAAAKAAEPLMANGGSIMTLTYLGAERVIPNYNVMGVAKAALEASVRYLASDLGPQGIRVNAISAGPTMTLSARGISGFSGMYNDVPERAPLRRNTSISDVGDTSAFLASDWSRGITGEVIYVDNGLHILG